MITTLFDILVGPAVGLFGGTGEGTMCEWALVDHNEARLSHLLVGASVGLELGESLGDLLGVCVGET